MVARDSYSDRVALVVGASGGIGRACAEAFAASGDVVALADVVADPLGELQGRLGPTRSSVHHIDLESAEVGSVVQDVVSLHGRLDILVCAAGTLRPSSVLDLAVDDWDVTYAVNVRGNVLLAQACARHFVEHRVPGRIVFFASILSRIARLNNVAYASSKAALVQAARCMALELAPDGITVNAISPGSTATQMLLGPQLGFATDAEALAVRGDLSTWRLGIPVGRLADPADQAALAVFLASDAARHITGQEFAVDGGQTLA